MGQPGHLLQLMDACDVDTAIMLPYVSERTPDNNAYCASLARQHPDRLATLTDVRLHEADSAVQVSQAREVYGAAGISYYPPKPGLGWLAESARESLWEAYRANDLVCNLQVTPTDYAVVLELCRRYPDIRFVLNHLALPGSLAPAETQYGGLLDAAAYPNLFVKASGFYACADRSWDLGDPRALGFLRQLVDGLGAGRVLWGSDWPPVGWHLTYRQALEIVRSTVGFSPHDLAMLLGSNAAMVYKI
jgi:L-fuconolactonase